MNCILGSFRGPLRQNNEGEDVIGDLFEVELKSKFTNVEEPTETTEQTERSLRIACTIDNGAQPINALDEGLKISFEGQVEKNSEILGRNAIWKKESRINRLPKYLCVNFVRFYWKQESVSAQTKAGKAKILRNVAFPKVLDLFDHCSEELKQSLLVGRELEIKNREKEDEANLASKKLDDEKKK